MQSSRTPPALQGEACLTLSRQLCREQNLRRRASRVERRGDPCQSLFTFRVPCSNLPPGTVQSRSETRPRPWPRRCRPSGHSTQACEIASQPNRDKCGNISTSSLATKMSDIQVDSQVPSLPDLRFRLSPPSVVAGRLSLVCDPSESVLATQMDVDQSRTRRKTL